MNPDTRVAVCGYAGDQHQIVDLMPLFRHHECPITVLSPDDSPVVIPGVDCRTAGKRCYIGWDGVLRMQAQLRVLLTYPENHFFINDSDSFCLSPELPAILYEEPNTVWSALIGNGVPAQQPGFAPGMPRVAFHPPWFLSRPTIETLLSVDVAPNEFLPFIDYWMVEAAVKSGLTYKALPGSMSVPFASHEPSHNFALDAVANHGFTFIHSVKCMAHALPILKARKRFLAGGKA